MTDLSDPQMGEWQRDWPRRVRRPTTQTAAWRDRWRMWRRVLPERWRLFLRRFNLGPYQKL